RDRSSQQYLIPENQRLIRPFESQNQELQNVISCNEISNIKYKNYLVLIIIYQTLQLTVAKFYGNKEDTKIKISTILKINIAIITPIGRPTVFNEPIILTIDTTIAYKQNSMI
ncbi:hypothetical protein BpHYR1_018761, partial [Brachionus plicatilis]